MVIDLGEAGETTVLLDRIMLIEEDAVAIEETKKTLTDNGFEVSITRDGGQAQSIIQMNPPDLILMQVILPGESGFEICEWVKDHYPHIPVLVYSELSLESAFNLAHRVGADGYLTKPASTEKLLDMMQRVAESVWRACQERDESDEEEEQGKIKFRCRCGEKFKEKIENRGRYITCSACQERLRIPNQSFHNFIKDNTASSDDTASTALKPLKFVTVKCPSCMTFYKLGNVEGDWRRCPRCEYLHTGSLSIVGAPMSRAALESSLRVLRILNGKSKGKKLMLPEREVTLGRAPGCDIRHNSSTIGSRHCSMTPTEAGIHIRILDRTRATFIDGERITDEGILKAGSVLRVGMVQFRLVGENLSIEDELQRIQKWSQKEQVARERGVKMIAAGKETAAEAAQVIQQHWNILRKRAAGEETPVTVSSSKE